MYLLNKKIQVATIATLLLPVLVSAATTGSADGGNNGDIVMYSLTGLMIILLMIIALLATTLRQLGDVLKDRYKEQKHNNSGIAKSLLLLLALGFSAFHTFAAETTEKVAATVAAPLVKGVMDSDIYFLLGILVFEMIIIFVLMYHIKRFLVEIRKKPEELLAASAAPEKSWFWDNFNAAVSIEKEKDILMDHDYDGIRELDNSLPPWWKYGFYLTIIVGCIYIYRFHVSHDGMSQKEEYEAEMKAGEEQKAAYLAKSSNNVDETNVVLLTDPAAIAEGKDIFIKNCAPCHLADGGGIVGPNLTDDYWLHGGSVKDIFKSIKYGWQDKGMKSWKDDFSPKQIQELTSFVKSLKGTHPATPKAPQGDLYIEGGQPTAGPADSTKGTTTTDTTKKTN